MHSSLSVTLKMVDRQRSIAVSPRRITERATSRWLALIAAAAFILPASPRAEAAPSESTAIGGTLTGPQTFAATSGTATITGNATLSGDVTFNLGFRVEYLVVGGGGGGRWGGGGGGQVVQGSSFLSAGTMNVVVGAGGHGDNATNGFAGTAGGSSVLGVITGTGGGIGSNYLLGGSGGGGYAGGDGYYIVNDFDQWRSAGGGGGAGGVGENGGDSGGIGGIGVTSDLTGASVGYGGGGSGIKSYFNNMSLNGSTTYGRGSIGYGGGAGGAAGAAGTSNTGGGGGGGATEGYFVEGSGGNGGSGFVAFRYLTGTGATGTVSGAGGVQSPGTGTAAGYTLVTYTSSDSAGSYALSQAQLQARLGATVTGSLTGSGGLSFAGPGRLTLSGSQGYSGPTTVQAGTLSLSGTIASSAVTVQSGGTLAGNGFLGSSLAIQSSGTLAPGNSPGQITASTLTLEAGSTTVMDIVGVTSGASSLPGTAGTNYDTLVVTTSGGLIYGGALSIVFTNTNPFADFTSFDLFQITGAASGAFSSIATTGSGIYANLSFSPDGDGSWSTADASNGQHLKFNPATGDLVIVPEPSTWLMGLAGLVSAGASMWRRRRPF